MRLHTLGLACAGLLAVSCSTSSSNDKPAPEQQANQEEARLQEEFAALPQAVMIRVEVDEAGKELNPQMRLVNASVADQAAADSAWASAPAATVARADELDGDMSTNSFHDYQQGSDGYDSQYSSINGPYDSSWGTSRGTYSGTYSGTYQGSYQGSYGNNHGGGYGSGGGYGHGYPNSGCGTGSFYCGYMPRAYSVVNTASYWSYGRPSCYNNHPRYRYYYYPRYCGQVSWCR